MISQEEIQKIFIPLIDLAYKSAGVQAEQIVGQAKMVLARESQEPEESTPQGKKKEGDK